jgi:hypothetical protein
MATFDTLTLAALLNDPLTQAMMRSDGVSRDDFAALLFRVKDTIADRDDMPELEWELAEV